MKWIVRLWRVPTDGSQLQRSLAARALLGKTCINQRIAARRREIRICSPPASEMKWIVRLWRAPTDGSQVNPSQ
ncbi:hypothetical protein F2Q68_00043692 [Brassica cretica]|uniref:Uncharacterized protein n=1 Tax=Brassica cretica TaxID=69181 RepID=A0A8S9LQ60_BRACR|nr:hypothetical protein F2Q68_00043692 [Brassica cretica]